MNKLERKMTVGQMFGYSRVSTQDQNLDAQREALLNAGCVRVTEEKASGGSREGRQELQHLLDFMRAGDILAVTKIDRLARSLRDLENIVDELKQKGATLKVLDQQIDTGSASGKCFLQMLGAFAEFERSLIKERQTIGIERAKAKGVYKGRPPKIEAAQIIAASERGLKPRQIAKELGIGRTSVWKALKSAA
jgi:DNA invertase Pin-like site-specific DNA recombinase